MQECRVYRATCGEYEPKPVHQTLPAFVRKFVLRHPSAAELLRDFDNVYMMVLRCPPAAEEGLAGGPEATAATAASAAPAAVAAHPPRLLEALTPRQRSAAHLCRVGEDEFYLIGFARVQLELPYEDPWPWVKLLHVPPALRGHGLGRATLDRLASDVFGGSPPGVRASVLDSIEHWG